LALIPMCLPGDGNQDGRGDHEHGVPGSGFGSTVQDVGGGVAAVAVAVVEAKSLFL